MISESFANTCTTMVKFQNIIKLLVPYHAYNNNNLYIIVGPQVGAKHPEPISGHGDMDGA